MKVDSQAEAGIIRDGAIAGQVPSIPTFRPVAPDVFKTRSERLVQLCAGHAMESYLRFSAALCQAQHEALHRIVANGAVVTWRAQLDDVLRAVRHALLPTEARNAVRTLLEMSDDAQEFLGSRLLEGAYTEVPAQFTPFLGAALQVHWTQRAIRRPHIGRPAGEECTHCPVCGSAPVAGVVRIGGAEQGLRYLACSLCGVQWHYTRIKCSACASTRNINYLALAGGTGTLKAETCDECGTYLKVFYMEKDTALEPQSDDLATVALDMLVDAEGYQRFSPNLLLCSGPGLPA